MPTANRTSANTLINAGVRFAPRTLASILGSVHEPWLLSIQTLGSCRGLEGSLSVIWFGCLPNYRALCALEWFLRCPLLQPSGTGLPRFSTCLRLPSLTHCVAPSNAPWSQWCNGRWWAERRCLHPRLGTAILGLRRAADLVDYNADHVDWALRAASR